MNGSGRSASVFSGHVKNHRSRERARGTSEGGGYPIRGNKASRKPLGVGENRSGSPYGGTELVVASDMVKVTEGDVG